MKQYIPVAEKIKVIRRDGMRCFYCGIEGKRAHPGCEHRIIEKERITYCGCSAIMHFDHVIPESRGGKTIADNLVLACIRCNLTKGAKIGTRTNDKEAHISK